MKFKMILFLILLIGSVGISSATDYYVSTIGNDTNNGLLVETPFLTVKHAATFTNPGDTVWIVNGTYYDEYKIKPKGSGNFTHRITFTAYNGTPIFRFSDANLGWVGDNTKLLFELWEYSYFNISNIYIDGYPGLAANIGSYTNIDNVSYMNQGGPITLSNGFESTEFNGSGYNSLTNSIIGGINETYGWNSFQLQGMYGAQNAHPSHDMLVANNKIYGNNMHNIIDLIGYMYNITIRDNEIYNGTYQAVFNHGSSDINSVMERIYFYNNNIYNMSGSAAGVTTSYWHDSLIYNNTFYNIPDAVPLSSTTADATIFPDNLTIYNNTFTDVNAYTTKLFLWSEGNHTVNISGVEQEHYFYGTSTYTNNNIDSYTFGRGGNITVLDNTVDFKVYIVQNATNYIKYSDNRIFTIDVTSGTDYEIAQNVRYKSDMSDFILYSNNSASYIVYNVTQYGATFTSSTGYGKDVSMNVYNVNDVSNITANVSEPLTATMTFTVDNASQTYNLSVNGVYNTSAVSNSNSIVEFEYTFSSTTLTDFEITWSSTSGWVVDNAQYIGYECNINTSGNITQKHSIQYGAISLQNIFKMVII